MDAGVCCAAVERETHWLAGAHVSFVGFAGYRGGATTRR